MNTSPPFTIILHLGQGKKLWYLIHTSSFYSSFHLTDYCILYHTLKVDYLCSELWKCQRTKTVKQQKKTFPNKILVVSLMFVDMLKCHAMFFGWTWNDGNSVFPTKHLIYNLLVWSPMRVKYGLSMWSNSSQMYMYRIKILYLRQCFSIISWTVILFSHLNHWKETKTTNKLLNASFI